jgi:hypothetical protein
MKVKNLKIKILLFAIVIWFFTSGNNDNCNMNFDDGSGTDTSEGIITGIVKESDLFTGVDGAEISVVGFYQTARSHDGGQFKLEHVPLGEQTILVKHEDYMTKEITNVNITGGEVIPLNEVILRDLYVDKLQGIEKVINGSYIIGKPDARYTTIENGGWIVVDLGDGEEAADGTTYADFMVGFKEAYTDTANILIGVSNYATGPFQRCEWNSEGVSMTGTGLDKARYIKIEYSAGESEGTKQIDVDYIRVLNYEVY